MTSDQKAEAILFEAVQPHLATDEGQKFLNGMATTERIKSLLSQHTGGVASQEFSQLLLHFMWEEISTTDFQSKFRQIFTSNPCLKTADLWDSFSPVLTGPVGSEAEQERVKKAFCDLLGLVTQKRDTSRPSLEDGMRFQQDVEKRFQTHPEKYERFLHASFGSWREGRDPSEDRKQMIELLEGEDDLLMQFGVIWPEKKSDKGSDGAA
ncbi:hypothetical protein JMJ35_007698 [Cladonia borealis]|uniref:Uncharacterized protein n=1 Tax=Cladonia borealis TaxID=184061 RepID=A0AA39QYI1_9LECA|nr:hypothetical protein JMJ35_007698 [Cladonia borealis]